MSETFDPYRKWLGIPPHEQPANHYRLLGIGVFETDLDVIQEAADRQMAHVQTHKNGRHSDLSQQLLNELTAAKLCLLNPMRRANYDDALRRQQAQQAAKASASALAKAAAPATAVPLSAAPTPARPATAAPARPAAPAASAAVEDFTASDGPTKRAARPRVGTAANKQKINPLLVLIPTVLVAVGLLYAIVSKLNSNSAEDTARELAAQKANQQVERKNKELIAAHANKSKPAPKEFSRPASRNTDDESDNPLTPADDGIPTEEPEPQPVLPPPVMSPEQIGELPSGGATQAVALSPNGARAITGGRDGSVRVWDMATKAELRRLEGHEGFINAVAFFPDSRRAVTAAHDGSVRLYDTETGKQMWSYVNIRLPMMSVAVSEDSRFIVAGGHQKIVRVWDVSKKMAESPEWSGLPEHVYGVGISPDGRRVFAACGGYWKRGKPDSGDDYQLHMLDTVSKKQSDLPGHEACIWSLAVSADGRRAATGCFDGTIRIWNVLGGNTQQILKGHTGSVWSVAFSKDGRRLLSGGDDRTVRLWNADTGKELKQLTGHSGAATCVGITADGSTGISGGSDGMARIWKLGEPSAAPVAKPPVEATAKTDAGDNDTGKTPPTDPTVDEPVAPVGKLPDFFAQPAPQGDPIPEESDQQDALKLVRQIFADDYKAAHKPQEKIALTEKLLEQAEQSPTPAERYVLYSEARSKARDAASPDLMIQVVEKMGGHFAINVFDELADSLAQLAREVSLPSVNKELAEKMQPLAEKAIANERYDVARRLLGTAFAAAGKTNDKALAKQIKLRGQEVVELKKHYDAAKAAAESLKTNPQDAAASYTLGRYLALDKEDWPSGLPLLAAGDNDSLKQIAAQELNAPAKAEDQVKLADAWWSLAEAGDAKDKGRLQARAEHWYRNAEPSLKGLTQTKVQKRLAELEESRPKLVNKSPTGAVDVATTSSPSKTPSAIVGAKPDKEKPVSNAAMTASVRALAGRMKGIARKKLTLTHSAVVGSTTNYGQVFEEAPGMLLVGINYTLNNNSYLSSLQPIYQSPKGQTTGTTYGFPNGAPQQILAKPGYAIGAIRGQGSYNIFGFEVEFMKVDAKGNLESGESYTHPWQGRRYTGDTTVTLGGDGQPIIGIYGKIYNQQFQSLGVIQPPADAK